MYHSLVVGKIKEFICDNAVIFSNSRENGHKNINNLS
jgi:hypothetical protein